jgi:hypothetical protein
MTDEITKTDVLNARKMIARLSELQPHIDKAKACGIECTEEDERCKQMKGFLIAFNELYGATIPAR